MKYLKLLTPAFVALALAISPAIFSQNLQAQNTTITANTATSTDAQPSFDKGQYGYSIEKIEYTADEMIVHFLYDEAFTSIAIYPPNAEKAWHVVDNQGQKIHPKAIRNLRHGDKFSHPAAISKSTHVQFVTDYDTYYNNYDVNKPHEKFQFRCEIVFPHLDKTVKTFDLIEGVKEYDNYFHVLNVQHRPTAAAVELVAEKELLGMPIEIIEPTTITQPLAITKDSKIIGLAAPTAELQYKHATVDFRDFIRSDKNPAQVSHDKDYTVDEIRYYENQTVVSFAFQNGKYPSGYFYGAQGRYAWFLRDQDGNIYKPTAVYNVRANGTVVQTKLENAEKLTLSTLVPQSDDIANRFTCDIVFPRLPASVRTADLIEGVGQENSSGHFNVKQIDIDPLQDNQVVEIQVVRTPTPPEELAKSIADCTENCKPTPSSDKNYTLFPNPNRGTFFLFNHGKNQDKALVQLFDLSGRLLFSQQSQMLENASQSYKVDNLAAGQYLVRISHQDNSQTTLPLIVVE